MNKNNNRQVYKSKQANLSMGIFIAMEAAISFIPKDTYNYFYLPQMSLISFFLLAFYNMLLKKSENLAEFLLLFTLNIIWPTLFYYQEDKFYIVCGMQLLIPILTFFLTEKLIFFIISQILQLFWLQVFLPFLFQEGDSSLNSNWILQLQTKSACIALVIISIIFSLYGRFTKNQSTTKNVHASLSESQYQDIFKIDYFLGSLINEIKSNITNISSQLVRLKEKYKENVNLQKQVNKLIYQSKNLIFLIDHFWEMEKLNNNTLKVNQKPVFMKDIFLDMQSIFSDFLNSEDLTGSIFIEKSIPHTLCIDKIAISQILMHLLSKSSSQQLCNRGEFTIKLDWVDKNCKEQHEFHELVEYENLDQNKTQEFQIDQSFYEVSADTINNFKFQEKPYQNRQEGFLRIIMQQTCSCIQEEQPCCPAIADQKSSQFRLSMAKQLTTILRGSIKFQSVKGIGSQSIVLLPTHYDPSFDLNIIKEQEKVSIIRNKRLKCFLCLENDSDIDDLSSCLSKLGIIIIKVCKFSQQFKGIFKQLIKNGEHNIDLVFLQENYIFQKGNDLEQQVTYCFEKLKINQSCQTIIIQNGKINNTHQPDTRCNLIRKPFTYLKVLDVIKKNCQTEA